MSLTKHPWALCIVVATYAAAASAATIQVGPTRAYKTIYLGYAQASSGDTIEIDSGTYVKYDAFVGIKKTNLTFRGVGTTRPVLDGGGASISNKGILWVDTAAGNNLTVENLEFINAVGSFTSGSNASGIRFTGTNLTVRNCYIHHNQSGIHVDGISPGAVLIENCEFSQNGHENPIPPFSCHNVFVNYAQPFIMQHCYSHDSIGGNLVVSRALTSYIRYNLLVTEQGTGSNELHISDGGRAYIIGNVIQHGPSSPSGEIITYGSIAGPNPNLYIINNTVINRQQPGAVFIAKKTTTTTGETIVRNNIFLGNGTETLITGSEPADVIENNWSTTDAFLANIDAHDYHLTAGSAGAIDAGITPGTGNGNVSLTPLSQYVPECTGQARPVSGTIDIGAYEYDAPPANRAPTVDAGGDIAAAYEGQQVNLHAAAVDLDGDALTYAWTQTAGADGLSPSVSTAADYSFTAPALSTADDGVLTFAVAVDDGRGGTVEDIVHVQVYMCGDADHNGRVNIGDLQRLIAAWGSSPDLPGWDSDVDFNDDSVIAVNDLQLLICQWGRSF